MSIPDVDEIWRPVPDYEDYYEVSNFGRIKSLERKRPYRDTFRTVSERILKPNIINFGYKQVTLKKCGIKKPLLIHRLVAIAFIQNPNQLPQVNHIDGNKLNNHVDNLEWCTAKENMIHSVKTGLRTDAKSIDMLTKKGELVCTFHSIHEAANQMNIWRSNIKDCLKHEHKSAGGYLWRYHKID